MEKYKYEKVYSWDVIDDIKAGKQVYVLDKKLNEVENARTLQSYDLISKINSEETERYYFYRAVKVDEK